MSRILPIALALVVTLSLSGCLGSFTTSPPTPAQPAADETFEFRMTGNTTNQLYVTVSLLENRTDSVTLEYANGTARNVSVAGQQGLDQGDAPSNLRGVEVGDGIVHAIHFEGAAPFEVRSGDLPKVTNVVYTVRLRRNGPVVAWGVVRCNEHVSALTLNVEDDTVTAGGLACRG